MSSNGTKLTHDQLYRQNGLLCIRYDATLETRENGQRKIRGTTMTASCRRSPPIRKTTASTGPSSWDESISQGSFSYCWTWITSRTKPPRMGKR